MFLGPWSLEWLSDQNHVEAGVISSSKIRHKKVAISQERQQIKKKKANCVLRHPMVSLKKVARMSSKDRNNVLKELKKQACKRRRGSVNNGVKVKVGVVSGPFEEDKANMFDVLIKIGIIG